jgi:hypothetical protein
MKRTAIEAYGEPMAGSASAPATAAPGRAEQSLWSTIADVHRRHRVIRLVAVDPRESPECDHPIRPTRDYDKYNEARQNTLHVTEIL